MDYPHNNITKETFFGLKSPFMKLRRPGSDELAKNGLLHPRHDCTKDSEFCTPGKVGEKAT